MKVEGNVIPLCHGWSYRATHFLLQHKMEVISQWCTLAPFLLGLFPHVWAPEP